MAPSYSGPLLVWIYAGGISPSLTLTFPVSPWLKDDGNEALQSIGQQSPALQLSSEPSDLLLIPALAPGLLLGHNQFPP